MIAAGADAVDGVKAARLEAAWRHLRLGIRSLGRRRVFTAVAMGTFALGVGAATAAYGLLESVVLAPLHYAAPDQLVRLYLHRPDHRQADLRIREFLSGPYLHALRTEAGVFRELSAVYAYRELSADLTDGDVPTRISVLPSSIGYFDGPTAWASGSCHSGRRSWEPLTSRCGRSWLRQPFCCWSPA